jgi:hypothetical protein
MTDRPDFLLGRRRRGSGIGGCFDLRVGRRGFQLRARGSADLSRPRNQVLEPQLSPQRLEGGIDPGGEMERNAEQWLELVEHLVGLAGQDLDA